MIMAPDFSEIPSVLDENTATKLIMQLMTQPGENALSEEDIYAAIREFTSWTVSAALVELWHRGAITLAWDVRESEFLIRKVDENRGTENM
jgi:hypothetical protein